MHKVDITQVREFCQKGSAIYRITRNPSKDELSGGKLRYVSHTTKDNYSWYNHMSELYKGQKLYANTYKTVTNIKIADMYALNDAAKKFIPDQKAYEKAVKELSTKKLIANNYEEQKYRSLSTHPYGPSYLASKGMKGDTSLSKKKNYTKTRTSRVWWSDRSHRI